MNKMKSRNVHHLFTMKILLVIFFMKLVLAWTGACDSKSHL
jgi:hypothetical protein